MTPESHIQFNKLVDIIIKQNPLQRKRIEKFCEEQGSDYWAFADQLSHRINRKILSTEPDLQKGAAAYNKMCMDFLKEQIKFKKSGKYSIAKASIAEENVYSQLDVMTYYMVGLLISYMLWPNHYKLYEFFLHHLPERPIKNYLEVGVGHGLFSSTVLDRHPTSHGTGIDISETSIAIAKQTLNAFDVSPNRMDFIHSDYMEADLPHNSFDFIIMGEVLEHVDDAPSFMRQTHKYLAPEGHVYLTTCANCPALDHVYHFRRVQEIRDLLNKAGFRIIAESALPADNVPEEEWEQELTTINYCCTLTKDH